MIFVLLRIYTLLQYTCFITCMFYWFKSNSKHLTFWEYWHTQLTICEIHFPSTRFPRGSRTRLALNLVAHILKYRPSLPCCLCPQHTCNFMFHVNSAHFSQRNPLRCDKSVTVEQKDHNTFFIFISLFIFTSLLLCVSHSRTVHDLTWHWVKWRCREARMLASKMSHFLKCDTFTTNKPLGIETRYALLIRKRNL